MEKKGLKCHRLFSPKSSSWMFDKVLKTLLHSFFTKFVGYTFLVNLLQRLNKLNYSYDPFNPLSSQCSISLPPENIVFQEV